MKAFTVEWVFDDHLLREDDGFTVQEMVEAGRLPVVRLAEVDALIQEAVWAMELQARYSQMAWIRERANAFLARPDVAAWRERQEKEPQVCTRIGGHLGDSCCCHDNSCDDWT